jgi:hypothetical protein
MEADWEVEIGGGAPVIEAEWPGFVDLRAHPERIAEIAEAVAFPPLAALLLALNAPQSPVWTSKCDVWVPEPESESGPESEHEPAAQASYIDLLLREGKVFSRWQEAEAFCREYVSRLAKIALPAPGAECSLDLVIRQAVAGQADGFGITAYLSAKATALAAAMAAFADALPSTLPPAPPTSKLQ